MQLLILVLYLNPFVVYGYIVANPCPLELGNENAEQ